MPSPRLSARPFREKAALSPAQPSRPAPAPGASARLVWPWMLSVFGVLAIADYALGSHLRAATILTVVQGLVLPGLAVVLWRGLRSRALAGTLAVFAVIVTSASLVLWAKVELLLAGDAEDRVAAYRTFVVLGFAVHSVGLLLRGDPLERALRMVANHQARLMAASFGMLALIGALLLTLPQSVSDLAHVSFVDALFTATSALCVTGLSVNVVGQTYTPFGQAVLLGLMETGGLGIMVLYSFFGVLTGRRLELRRAVVMAEMIDARSLSHLRRTLGGIVVLALVVQGVGVLALYTAFPAQGSVPSGAVGPWQNAVFHAVSAYTNAGFSLYHSGLVPFASSWSVCSVIMGLIVLGGLGFPVAFELLGRLWARIRRRRPERLSLHTRVVLWSTGVLIGGGTLLFLSLEWNGVLRDFDPGTRLLVALFQSVTTRTAGFNTLDFAAVAPATLLATCALMFIGASPGSTGGGIKTTTFAALLATLRAELRRREQVCLMGRSIPAPLQRRAIAVALLGGVAVVVCTFLLLLTESHAPLKIVFEVVSALGTVGLSTGITPELSVPGRLLLTLAMLVGRLGPLTVMIALAEDPSSNHTTLPEEKLGIG